MQSEKSALIAALDRGIGTEADDKAALPHEVREKAEAEVQGDLLAVERDVAALVWSAIEQTCRSSIEPTVPRWRSCNAG